MISFYKYHLTDTFTGEEITTAEGTPFSIDSPEEAALLLEVLNSGYVDQGELPRVALSIKPITLIMGGNEVEKFNELN